MLPLTGCVQVGTGNRTVRKAPLHPITEEPQTTDLFASLYPHLVVKSKKPEYSYFKGNSPIWQSALRGSRVRRATAYLFKTENELFDAYKETKYGSADSASAVLGLIVKNPSTFPPFSTDLHQKALIEVGKIMSDPNLSLEKKLGRKAEIEAVFLNHASTVETTALHHYDDKGRQIFYYYPRISLDFSAEVLSPNLEDRFSSLAVVVLLHQQDYDRGVRFLDFSPKGADILEYTRGQFKQNSQIQGKATYGRTASDKETTTETAPGLSNVAEQLQSATLGGDISYTYSEAYERDLKDALIKRTYAIVENGQGFIADYRSLRNMKVGGTYNFDLMVEIPSTVESSEDDTSYTMNPIVGDLLKADFYMIGVVRHVYDRGLTGVFNRVPESENDDVYEEVVTRILPEATLWELGNHPWVRPKEVIEPMFKLTVNTNLESARYIILRKGEAHPLTSGGGFEKALEFPTTLKLQKGEIIFLNAIVMGENGDPIIMKPDRNSVEFTFGDGGESIGVIVQYENHP